MSNIAILNDFIEFEKSCKKELRGEEIMYDIKGQYRYLTLSELFDYYFKTKNK